MQSAHVRLPDGSAILDPANLAVFAIAATFCENIEALAVRDSTPGVEAGAIAIGLLDPLARENSPGCGR